MPIVLVVDDQPELRLVCRELLEQNQVAVLEAGDGREAVNLYRQFRPDAVTLDLNMPVLNGLEALKKIRDFDPRARVAVLSALGHEQLVVRAIRAGACDYILKPFTIERLEQAVQRLLEHPEPGSIDADDSTTTTDKYGPHFWIRVSQRTFPDSVQPVQPEPVRVLRPTSSAHRCPIGRPCTFRGCLLSR
jgi:two-component system chemotaxis response regulator CheY